MKVRHLRRWLGSSVRWKAIDVVEGTPWQQGRPGAFRGRLEPRERLELPASTVSSLPRQLLWPKVASCLHIWQLDASGTCPRPAFTNNLVYGKCFAPQLFTRGAASSSRGTMYKKSSTLRDEVWQLKNLEGAIAKMENLGGKHPPQLQTCNEVINALADGGMWLEAKSLMERMRAARVVPDERTFCMLIKAYNRAGKAAEAEEVLTQMREWGLPVTVYAYTAVMDAMANAGKVANARRVMEQMLETGCEPNKYTYSVMFKAYSRAGRTAEAEDVLRKMLAEGKEVCMVLLTQHVTLAFSQPEGAKRVHTLVQQASHRGIEFSESMYQSLIRGYTAVGMLTELEELVENMKTRKVSLSMETLHLALFSLSHAGRMTCARSLLEAIRSSPTAKPSTWTFNILIKGYAMARMGEPALLLLSEMLESGPPPNSRTYASVVKALCSENHFEAARAIFDQMRELGHRPEAETYLALMRGYSRAGLHEDAHRTIKLMLAENLKPSEDVLRALVEACMASWKWREALAYAPTAFGEKLKGLGRPGWVLDLHGMETRVALTAVIYALFHLSKIPPEAMSDSFPFHIITGQGRNSRIKDYSVVREEVVTFLDEQASLKFFTTPWNKGRLTVTAIGFERWVRCGRATELWGRLDLWCSNGPRKGCEGSRVLYGENVLVL